MVKTNQTKSKVFFERGSWYHRTKELQDDYTVKYGKLGGFKTEAEAEESRLKYEEKYQRQLTDNHLQIDSEVMLADYLIYWFENIFRERNVDCNYETGIAYVIYNFIVPILRQEDGKANIKLKLANTDYFNSLLKELEKITPSAGNKCREVLFHAMRNAKENNYIKDNPVELADKYYRNKPNVKILNENELSALLKSARYGNWYLEILLATFCGLRKGEIIGLKFSDFNIEKQTVSINRQLVISSKIAENEDAVKVKVDKYELIEKPPKKNSYRTLRVPKIIIKELEKRMKKHKKDKEIYKNFEDYEYVSFQEDNGKPHSPNSLNSYLKKVCKASNVPLVSVHSLRHLFATILIENGVPIIKISALLGHSNPHTTFEVYCDIMEERGKILNFINNTFTKERMEA